jgi:hypothetical protein
MNEIVRGARGDLNYVSDIGIFVHLFKAGYIMIYWMRAAHADAQKRGLLLLEMEASTSIMSAAGRKRIRDNLHPRIRKLCRTASGRCSPQCTQSQIKPNDSDSVVWHLRLLPLCGDLYGS